jgi:hypothetical protein
MIYINPQLKGKKTFETSSKHFPHLFNANGEQIHKTYIYMLFNDIIVESTEGADEIQKKTRDFINHKIKCLESEAITISQTIKELKAMI